MTLRLFNLLTLRPILMREPLVHFVLLGALLFGVYALVGGEQTGPVDQIIITEGQIDQLAVGFSRTWQRPPTEEELKGLIDDRIREEVFYREAIAIGLDRDDTIVRRRMRQKLEFLTEDLAAQFAPPTDQEIEDYFTLHADTYREEATVSFEHISFSRDRRGKSAEADARAALAQLNGKGTAAVDLDSMGDATLLPVAFHLAPRGQIARMFGEGFARELMKLDPKSKSRRGERSKGSGIEEFANHDYPLMTGGWSGPIESPYGLHLVRIREQVPGRSPELARVRDTVLRDLLAERRTQALEATYAELRRRYSVTIEESPRVAGSSKGRRVEESKSQRVAAK